MTAPAPRFVELIRVSTTGQADRDTPADQRAALDRLRKSRPGVLVERIDSTVSGAKDSDDRKDLTRLFALCEAKAVDELRVRHVDRITRHADPRQRAAVFGALMDAGAKVVEASGREIDPADEMGELDLWLQGWLASRERKRILERTIAGRKRAAAAGRLAQGRPPFGRTFKKATGRWGVDPEQARTYRRMFDLCLAGRSLAEVAAVLNREGRPTARGGTWSDASVLKLLRAPAAAGRYATHGQVIQLEPIVDEATLARAAARLKANRCERAGPKPTTFALLRKLAACGFCGSPLYVQLGGGTPSRTRYYRCSSGDPACLHYQRVDDVDAKVVDLLRGWLRDPGVLAAAAGRGAPEGEREAARREAAEAEADLRKLPREELNVARRVTRGQIRGQIADTLLGEIAARRQDAEERLAAARARGAAADRSAAEAAGLDAAVAALRERLGSATPARWRALVEALFPRGGIRVHPDGQLDLAGRVPLPVPDLLPALGSW